MNNLSVIENLVPSYVQKFEAYAPSRPDNELKKIYGCNTLIRLNNNENPLGPPLEAQKIIDEFEPYNASIYPNGDSHYMRMALAEKYGKNYENFLVGNGSNELITSVIKAFCEKGDNIITADKTFAVYEWVAEFSGVEARLVPLVDYAFDYDGMLDRIDKRTKIIFICNPNNPTGTYWPKDKLTAFLDAVNGRQIVVLDEAYIEYVEHDDFPDGMNIIKKYPNVVVFRTFSKMYALAGLRIGYLCGCEEVVNLIKKTYVAYSVNVIAQAAALAALKNADIHIKKTRELMRAGKGMVKNMLDSIGMKYICGEGNYLMIKVPISDTSLYRILMGRGVMIRTMTGFRFPGWIRLTISKKEYMEEFCEVFSDEINKIRNSSL